MNEFNLVNIISDIISFGDEGNYVQNIKVFLIRMTKSNLFSMKKQLKF